MGRRPKRPDSGISGCAIVDKPAGCTSHDVVDELRKKFGTQKVGHAGTLDPSATGVLVLGVGKGTKMLQFVTGTDKSYFGELVLGVETDSLDADGVVTATHEMTITPDQVAAAAANFVGDIEQIPPMVSAVRIDGKRLHELAREGKTVEREPRPVTVHRYKTTPTDDPLVYRIDVKCSSGTYVRSLAADVGTALGGGAHLRNLRRTAVGQFLESEAASVADLELLPHTQLLRGLPTLQVDDVVAAQVRNGRSLGPSGGDGRLAVADESGEILAVYESRDGEFKAVKVLAAE